MRTSLILFHRWLALAASVVIILLGVTGGALVFEGAIDRAMHPELWRVTPAGSPLPLDTLVAHVRARARGAAIGGLSIAVPADRAYVVQAGVMQVFVNQYTGAIQGTRDRGAFDNSLPRRLHRLHVNLMFGQIGSEIIAAGTVASFLLVLSGIYLWWSDKLWRVRWSASWKRIVYDLHHSLGILAALVILVITGSGMIMHYRALGTMVASIGSAPRDKPPVQVSVAGRSDIALDSASRVAVSALPGATVSMMSFPAKPDQPFVVTMRYPEDRTPGGRSRVYIDRFDGVVLQTESTRSGSTGSKLTASMRSIHTGDVLGKPSEGIWLLAALILAGQGITGLIMWWNGRPARAALARKSTRVATPGTASG